MFLIPAVPSARWDRRASLRRAASSTLAGHVHRPIEFLGDYAKQVAVNGARCSLESDRRRVAEMYVGRDLARQPIGGDRCDLTALHPDRENRFYVLTHACISRPDPAPRIAKPTGEAAERPVSLSKCRLARAYETLGRSGDVPRRQLAIVPEATSVTERRGLSA